MKAKNFSSAYIEVIKTNSPSGTLKPGYEGLYKPANQPIGYTAFKWTAPNGNTGASSGLSEGADHNSVFSGWASNWPGAVVLSNVLQ